MRQVSLRDAVFGKSSLTQIPATPDVGTPYRDASILKSTVENGWPFSTAVNSADFNECMFRIFSLMNDIEKQGFLHWSELTDYVVGSITCDEDDGKFYKAVQASGPNSGGYHQPSEDDGTYWTIFEFLPLSGGNMKGWITNPQPILEIYVGDNREFTNLEDAFSYISKLNGNRIIIHVDPFKSDGVTIANYTMPAQVYGLTNYISVASTSTTDKPVITSDFFTGFGSIIVFEYIKFINTVNINFGSYAEFVYCDFDISANQDATRCIYVWHSSSAYFNWCSFIGGKSAGKQIAIAIQCLNGSFAHFYAPGLSSIDDCTIALHASFGSQIDCDPSQCTITNTTTISSPAINTLGNGNGYVAR